MSELASVIHDGYTQPFYFRGVPGLHPDVRGTFRPMLHHERYFIGGKIADKQSGPEQSRMMIEAICSFIRSWDLKGSDGKVIPREVPAAVRIKPHVVERLYMLVTGREGGDVDPNAEPAKEEADAEWKAILEQREIGPVREEIDAKNL